jgi:hypothetical protein
LQGVQANRVDPDKKYTKEWVIGTIASRGLAPLDWRKLMVDVTTEIAINLGMETVGIQGGVHNKWTKIICDGETAPHLSKAAARKAYDQPAKRLGFTKGKDKNWHKQLVTSASAQNQLQADEDADAA